MNGICITCCLEHAGAFNAGIVDLANPFLTLARLTGLDI